jgi:hypothetical protein
MIRRLVILQIILLAGLGSIWLLPSAPDIQQAALNPELPRRLTLTGWSSSGELTREGSAEEIARLAKDTEFYRRQYRREVSFTEQPVEQGAPVLVDELNVGVVLSGSNLSGSIHALERCLVAQGFNIPSASTMHIKLRSGHTLPVRRLVCERSDKESNTLQRNIAYYWFVGHDAVTSNHIKRGLRDFWDRIVHGYDQRWAYVTITAQLNGSYLYEELKKDHPLKEGEELPRLRDSATGRFLARRQLTEEQSDKLVEEFVQDIGPDIIKVDQIKEWPEE